MARKIVGELFVARTRFHHLWIYLASSEKGAVRVCVEMSAPCEPHSFFAKMFPHRKIIEEKGPNLALIHAVKSALTGKPVNMDIAIDVSLTPFQSMAYRTISHIPYGHTRTYGEVARAMGRPKAARAVGQAMRSNPLPIIFP